MYTVPMPQNHINQQTREIIGEAIYLYLHIIDRCNWEDGTLCTTIEAVANETGFPYRTVRRWMDVLSSAGIISVRRTRIGSYFAIRDYKAIAHTRGAKSAKAASRPSESNRNGCSNRPRAAVRQAASGRSQGLQTAVRKSASGRSQVPQTAVREAASGRSIIMNQNISQNNIQNILQNKSLLSMSHEGKGADETKPDIFDYTDPWQERLNELAQRLNSMDQETISDLFQQALSDMARDSRPFMRMFVKASETGALEPAGPSGPEMMMRRVWQNLEKVDG